MTRLLPFLFLILPLTEIAVFVLVGSQIGALATVGLVVATAFFGAILLRVQGFGILARIRAEMDAGRVPGRDLVHGVMILLAGLLLIIPGFVTDALGLMLFLPWFRDVIWSAIGRNVVVMTPAGFAQGHGRREDNGGTVIDLEEGEFTRRADPDSPWRRPER
jgi:UPF0716 protein FxsA